MNLANRGAEEGGRMERVQGFQRGAESRGCNGSRGWGQDAEGGLWFQSGGRMESVQWFKRGSGWRWCCCFRGWEVRLERLL